MDLTIERVIEQISREVDRVKEASYYDVLSVEVSAHRDDIDDRYWTLARQYHGDRYHHLELSEMLRGQMDELLALYSRAHDTLANPEKKKEYDATLAMKKAGIPSDIGTIMQAEKLFKQGLLLMDKGVFASALEHLDNAAELNPAEPEFAMVAAYCKFWTLEKDPRGRVVNRKLLSLIIDHIMDYIESHPKKDSPLTYLGQIAKSEGNASRAYDCFQEALHVNPNNLIAAREIRLMEIRSGGQSAVKSDGFVSRFLSIFKR